MSTTILGTKTPLSLRTLFNVTSFFFVLPNIVLCDNSDGDADYIRRAIVENHNVTGEDKVAKKEEDVDNVLVWACIVVVYALFGLILYLMINSIIERKRKKKAREVAIKDLEMSTYDDMYKEITKPPPVMISDTKKEMMS